MSGPAPATLRSRLASRVRRLRELDDRVDRLAEALAEHRPLEDDLERRVRELAVRLERIRAARCRG